MAQPPVGGDDARGRRTAREAGQDAVAKAQETAEKARLTFRRLSGLDRSGPPPPQTLSGQPLHPWTIPNAIGYVRLALIPVFLAFAFSSGDGVSRAAVITFAVIAWSDYLDGIAALQAAVTRDVPAGFLRAKSREQLRAYLDGTDGVAFGIVGGGRLLASALLRLPQRVRPNAGEPFPLVPTADWPLRAAFLEHAMVRREVRGRGYHRALFAARHAQATVAGMRWMCAGARLDNTVSWSNLLASGLVMLGATRWKRNR